jgi:hypothetical protein
MSGDVPLILSRLEKGFLRRLREARLPRPITNRRAGAHYVDCRWPDYKLTVELDSYTSITPATAGSRTGAASARRARGDEFRRYTWGDVFEEPKLMLAELRALLPAVRGYRPSSSE